MTSVEVTQSIMHDIVRCYGSLDAPKFHFVREVIERDPYQSLVKDISGMGYAVADYTNLNEDVAYYLVVTRASGTWGLYLSLVGPYAFILRIGDETPSVVDVRESFVSEGEEELVNACRRFGLKVLDLDELECRVPISLSNVDAAHANVYNALFSDSEFAPWQYGALEKR